MQIPFFEDKANIPKYFLDIRSCRCSLWDINVFHYLGNIRRIFATILLTSAYITTRVCSKCASNLQFMHTKTHLIVNNLMFETDCAFHSKDSLNFGSPWLAKDTRFLLQLSGMYSLLKPSAPHFNNKCKFDFQSFWQIDANRICIASRFFRSCFSGFESFKRSGFGDREKDQIHLV